MKEKEALVKAEKKQKKAKKTKDITVKANKKGRHVMRLMNFLRLLFPLYKIVKPFQLYGNKRVQDGPLVYVCNHYAMLDPVYPMATTREGIHFIAKKELFEAPVVGWLLRRLKGISANRDGNDVRVLLDSFKCLKNGEKICIFPEGTRNRTGEVLAPFEHGASAIAIKAKIAVLPMMIYNKPRYFRKTHVLVGEPFELDEYYGKKLTEADYKEADEKIRGAMLSMYEEHKTFLESKGKKAK